MATVVSASSAQNARWTAFGNLGFAFSGASTVTGDGLQRKTDHYMFDGPALDAGIERILTPRHSLRLIGTMFTGGDAKSVCVNQRCDIRSRAFALASVLAIHREERHQWGPSGTVGLTGMRVLQHGGFRAGQTLGTAFGGTGEFSFSFGAVRHIAPMLAFRYSKMIRTDLDTMNAGSIGVFLQTR